MNEDIPDFDPADMTPEQVEELLRDCLVWARAKAATARVDDPVRGRAASLIATYIEEALYRLLNPVP